jgi:hypothetical protein
VRERGSQPLALFCESAINSLNPVASERLGYPTQNPLAGGGPHYRELRELFRVLHMAYEESKKLADELLDEDEQ